MQIRLDIMLIAHNHQSILPCCFYRNGIGKHPAGFFDRNGSRRQLFFPIRQDFIRRCRIYPGWVRKRAHTGKDGMHLFQVGIVGCGGIARVHAAVLHQLPDTNIAACADIIPERAEALAAQYGCRAYRSMEEMLDAERLDSVHLCTPHALHTPMAVAAARRGIAVFTEKPPVISHEQWTQLEQAAAQVPLGVCFQNRYNPNVQAAKDILETGQYGALTGARAFITWHRDESYYRDSGWRGAWATEGGSALINQAIHTLDLLVRLMGPADLAETHMVNHHLRGVIETEDTVEAYLRLGGKPVLFFASTAYAADAPVLIELQAEQAALRLEWDALEIITGHETQRRTFDLPQTLGKGYWGNGHLPCIRDFYHSLASGKPFRNDLASVRDTVMLMLAMYDQGRKALAEKNAAEG